MGESCTRQRGRKLAELAHGTIVANLVRQFDHDRSQRRKHRPKDGGQRSRIVALSFIQFDLGGDIQSTGSQRVQLLPIDGNDNAAIGSLLLEGPHALQDVEHVESELLRNLFIV